MRGLLSTGVVVLMLIGGVFISNVSAATASISKVVFTSDTRTVALGEVSEAITIQLQNSSGEEEKLDVTADVEFESSSASGEFLGGTGKAITKTMSTGSANKTFYYRDSSGGSPTITVKVTPRSGSKSFTASQKIYVGVSGNDSENEDGDETEEDDSSSSSSNSSSKSGTHSSSVKLSNFSKKTSLQVGAGRDRVVMVNTPISFEAEVNQGSAKVKPRMDYIWSFGDGEAKYGRVVTHTYFFPGEYHVVLNADKDGERSVSRSKVTVLDSSIEIGKVVSGAKGYVEVKNLSSSEVNINDWKISIPGEVKERYYIIPQDTIIGGGKSIRIPNTVSLLDVRDRVALQFPNDDIAFEYKEVVGVASNKPTYPSAPLFDYLPVVVESKAVEKIVEKDLEEKVEENQIQSASVSTSPPSRGFFYFLRSLFTVH